MFVEYGMTYNTIIILYYQILIPNYLQLLQSTYKLSLLAVGSTVNLVESICKGDVQNGMAIIR